MAPLPAAAEAQDAWRPVVTSCVNDAGDAGCANGRSFSGAWNTVLSADGRTAYTAAFGAVGGGVGVFDRDPATGALAQRPGQGGCISETGGECRDGRALTKPDGIFPSPDGQFVYVSNWDGGVAVLDVQGGELFQSVQPDGCITDTGSANGAANQCVNGHGLASVTGPLQVSPDGRHLYTGTNPVAVLARDAATGRLTQDTGEPGCVSSPAQDSCRGVRGLGVARQPAIAPDGRHLYVPNGDGIAILDRDAGTGELRQRDGAPGCISAKATADGCAVDPRVAGTTALVASADGRHVYATGPGGIVTLDRAADGGLAVRGCILTTGTAGCAQGSAAVAGLAYAAISPDGQDLVATHLASGTGVTVFARDPATGDLRERPGPDGCLSSDGTGGACTAHPAMGSDTHVAFAGNEQLYTGGFTTSAVAALKRDFLPVCADSAASVAHNTSAPVPLSCRDANGDPLAVAIRTAPRSGSLGAIDAAQGRVFYDPFGGFSGPDEFTYGATAAGLDSAPARVALDVAAPAAVPPRLRRIGSAVATRWGVRGKRIFLLSLAVRRPPAGARLELRCKGGKRAPCPFAKRGTKRRRKGSITLFKPVAAPKAATTRARRFRAGQRLQVRVTAPGHIGKVVVFDLRRGKIPSGAQRCLPPGARTPRKRC